MRPVYAMKMMDPVPFMLVQDAGHAFYMAVELALDYFLDLQSTKVQPNRSTMTPCIKH